MLDVIVSVYISEHLVPTAVNSVFSAHFTNSVVLLITSTARCLSLALLLYIFHFVDQKFYFHVVARII